MAWSAPRTWVVGELVTAAIMNTFIRDNQVQLYDGMPAARVFHNANQATATAVPLILTFNSERFDNDTIHDLGVNPSRLTCITAGKYAIFATVQWQQNAVNFREIGIFLNGVTLIAVVRDSPRDNQVWPMSVSTLYDFLATDFVEVRVFQDSGGALNIETFGNYSPEFMMVKVG